MQNIFKSVVVVILTFLTFAACNPNNPSGGSYADLPADSAGTIIKECIEKSGGLDAWQKKNTLSLTKLSQSFDSAGNLKRETVQEQYFQYHPTFKARISWTYQDTNYICIYDGDHAKRYVNLMNVNTEKDMQSAWNTIFGAEYVLCMPYKLADAGAKYEYEGEKELFNKKVYAIKVSYPKDNKEDTYPWTYFFDVQTKELEGYSNPGNGDQTDVTHYDAFTTIDGIKLPMQRTGYVCDKERKPLYKSSFYRNSNFKFYDAPSDTIFTAPVNK
ncbi:MAG: hypothetical protein ABJA79_10125 [Parafilimonas sp.]